MEKRSTLAICLATVSGGCAALQPPTQSSQVDLRSNSLLSTTATTRVGFSREATSQAKNRARSPIPTNEVVCVEPSPDVVAATTVAVQLAGELGGQDAASGSAGATVAQSVAELGRRLATVQLLRDGLYRACEAYANGAISDTSYTMMLSRMDDVMISLFALELAADSSPGQATIGGGGFSLGGGYFDLHMEEMSRRLERQRARQLELEYLRAKLEEDPDAKVLVLASSTVMDLDPEGKLEGAVESDAKVQLQVAKARKADTDAEVGQWAQLSETAFNFTATRAVANASISGGVKRRI